MAEVKVGAPRGPPQSATPHPYQPPDAGDMKAGGGYGPGGTVGSAEEALRVAAGKGQTERVRELLQARTALDTDEDGRTALHYAAHNGHPELCRLLINHGCPLDLQDSGGYTAVQRACSQGQVEALEVCVQGGCGVNLVDQHGNTALHEAAWHGYSQSVELLIKHNANVFATNKSGFTALHLAAQNGHNESARMLLYGAIDPDLQNNYGDTALHTAARYGHAGVTRILISAKCQLHLQNKNGDTALHIAAALKRRKIAKILVESHADIHVHNKQNETAVDVARRKDNPEIVLIINSLARTHSSGLVKGRGEVVGVTFKEDVEPIEDGPAPVCPEEEQTAKPEKERGFFAFFKKKRKDKDKEGSKEKGGKQPVKKALASTSTGTHGGPPSSGAPPSIRRVSGFFSHYVPQNGTQYYRDLAGNIKQGPVGYTPVCHCRPVFQHIEQTMMDAREKLYDHIHASHQVLQDRIRQLDLQTSQQAHLLDPGTRQRMEAERRACQASLDQRLQQERQRAQLLVQSYGEGLHSQVQGWLEDRLSSYGHCLDHHHDDTALPPNHIFTDVHYGPNGGRLFRSRSDETLSASDNSGRGRKRQFYESRKAAMEQIRGWKVPVGKKEASSSRRRERRPSTDTLDKREGKEDKVDQGGGVGGGSTGRVMTVTADIHHSCDQLADVASSRHGGQDGEGREGGVDRWEGNASRAPFTGAGGRHSPSFDNHTPRSAQFLPYVHPGQPTPYPPNPHHRQPYSHGNPSSQHASQWGTSTAGPSQGPPEAQLPRGILHGNARDNGVYERSRSSSRLRPMQPRERVDRTHGHEAAEEKGPVRAVSPIRPYNGERGGSHQPHPSYALSHYHHSVHSPLPDEGHRWHVRTRSTEGLLEGMDSGGGRRRSRSEERVLDSSTGRQQLPAAFEDHSGYVTDSATRNTHLYHTDLITNNQRLWNSNNNFSPMSSQKIQLDSVDSGNRDQILRHPRSNGTQSSWKEQSQYGTSHVHSERGSAGDQRSGYGQQAPSSRHSSSAQQQGWPPTSSYHPSSVQTRTMNNGGAQYNPYDRMRPKTPIDKDTPPYPNHLGRADTLSSGNNTKVHNSQSSSDGRAHSQPESTDDSAAPVQHFSTFKPLSDRVVLQDTRCTQHTDNPGAHGCERGGQGKEQATGRNSAPLGSSAQLSTGSGRTSSPRQTYTASVGKSNMSLSQDGEPSPREPVSSGHYSVSAACLRHNGLSAYSPVEQADSKEDSTCSSNQDSGYSSRVIHGNGGRRGAGDSTTPSSSFSTDHSLSAGTPSTAGSPYMHLSGHSYSDYVPMAGGNHASHQGNSFSRAPEERTLNGGLPPDRPREEARNYRPPGQQAGSGGLRPGSQAGLPTAGNVQRQVQGWYQHKLLEAAQRLRNSQQYRQPADSNNIHTAASSSSTPGVRFDPVHGSDV